MIMEKHGGLKNTLGFQEQKEDGQTMVEVELIVNGERKRVSIGKFRELFFDSPKKAVSKDLNIINGEDVYNYIKDYGKEMCDEFIEYWTETTTRGNRYKWKTEKTFKVGRRLKQWAKRDYNGLYADYCVEKRKQEDFRREQEMKQNSNPEEFRKFMSSVTKQVARKLSV